MKSTQTTRTVVGILVGITIICAYKVAMFYIM